MTKNPGSPAKDSGETTGLILAGVGPVSIAYEIGVLLCLTEFLDGADLEHCNFNVGIGSGALVAACLAQGFSMTDLFQEFISPGLRSSADAFFKPAFRELGRRATKIPRLLFDSLSDYARDPVQKGLFDSLTRLGRALPVGFLDGEGIRKYVHELFTSGQRRDDFRTLKRNLTIVVADLDSGAPVRFGEVGFEDVPISSAVQASMAFPALYSPVEVHGRHYVDGSLLRTFDALEVMSAGARLIFCVNPIVPVNTARSVEEGVMRTGRLVDRGLPTVLSQVLRKLARPRLDLGMALHDTQFRGVDVVRIEPRPDDYRMFFGNLFGWTDRKAACEHGFQSTLRNLRYNYNDLEPVLRRHGVKIQREAMEAADRRGVGVVDADESKDSYLKGVLDDLGETLDRLDKTVEELRGPGAGESEEQ